MATFITQNNAEKIEIAQGGRMNLTNLNFDTKAIQEVEPTHSDALIILDTLHYLTTNEQSVLLNAWMKSLKDGGIIILTLDEESPLLGLAVCRT